MAGDFTLDLSLQVGKYDVQKLLGKGATGTVYLARDTFSGKEVALKTIEPEVFSDPEFGSVYRVQFLNEASLAGSPHYWDDYTPGERIDHVDGMTIEESCHMTATRLYQNTAKVHFNQHAEKSARFGRRIVYGGHVISLARALSFNGLANAFRIAAINGGRHLNPCFAGDTVYAWSAVVERLELPGRRDAGGLRIRTYAAKDRSCADFPAEGADLLLDLDYTVILPRR